MVFERNQKENEGDVGGGDDAVDGKGGWPELG
jgi:hypothetical protein